MYFKMYFNNIKNDCKYSVNYANNQKLQFILSKFHQSTFIRMCYELQSSLLSQIVHLNNNNNPYWLIDFNCMSTHLELFCA